MKSKLTLILTGMLLLTTMSLYCFLNGVTARCYIHLGSILFALVTAFIAWHRAGDCDEDRLYWLGVWITFLLIALEYPFVSTYLFGEWSVFAGTLAVIFATAGLGLTVMIFQSHISERTPRKSAIAVWISTPIIVIGYLFYFTKYAPLETITYISGKPEIVSGPYVLNALVLFSLILVSALNTIILQSKLWMSDKHKRIDLWLSSSALYLTFPIYIFPLVTPTIIQTAKMGATAMMVGDHLLIPICILIGVSGIARSMIGEIEKNPFKAYTGMHEDRFPSK